MSRSWAVVCLLACGCAESEVRPQIVVVVDTDAVVPRFGERLRVDVLDAAGGVCSGCTRVFDVSEPRSWPQSFGVVPDGLALLRLRLYRDQDQLADGVALPGVTIDRLAPLPSPGDEVQRGRVTLRMDCSGRPPDVAGGTTCVDRVRPAVPPPPLEPDSGEGATVVGTWPGAAEVWCTGQTARDEVCVPGGAYHMGDDRYGEIAAPAHLVTMRPFFLDVDEVAVGSVRQWLASDPTDEAASHYSPQAKTGKLRGCTLPASLGEDHNDRLPVTCVRHDFAAAYCASIGKRLPRESEWEWVSRGRDRDSTFPWGDDPSPSCAEVAVERAPQEFETIAAAVGAGKCAFPDNSVVPPRIASSPRDVSREGVRDLAGSVHEWMRDSMFVYSSDCWTDPALPPSPECIGESTLGVVYRGSSWTSPLVLGRAAGRRGTPIEVFDVSMGFRCARDDGTPTPDRPAPLPFVDASACTGSLSQLWRHRDAKVGTSGIYSNAYLPGYVTDGDTDTCWFAEPDASDVWIEVVLPFQAEILGVEVLGITGNWSTGSDFEAGRIELYPSAGPSAPIHASPIVLENGTANGTLLYPEVVKGVTRVRFVGETWEGDSPGIGELHVWGYCPDAP